MQHLHYGVLIFVASIIEFLQRSFNQAAFFFQLTLADAENFLSKNGSSTISRIRQHDQMKNKWKRHRTDDLTT